MPLLRIVTRKISLFKEGHGGSRLNRAAHTSFFSYILQCVLSLLPVDHAHKVASKRSAEPLQTFTLSHSSSPCPSGWTKTPRKITNFTSMFLVSPDPTHHQVMISRHTAIFTRSVDLSTKWIGLDAEVFWYQLHCHMLQCCCRFRSGGQIFPKTSLH